MNYHGNHAGQNTDDVRHGVDQDHQHHGIGRSIRPGTAVPDTVFITRMGNGALLLHGWRDGPSTYLSPSDTIPLRRQPAAAFGSTALALSDVPGEAP